MINFEEELKKCQPSTEVEDIEEDIYNRSVADIAGVFEQMFVKKQETEEE